MSIVNARSSQFIFSFPKGWFPKPVMDKWTPYVKRLPIAYETVDAVVSSSIQSVTFPNMTMDPASQTRRLGKQQEYKSSKPIQDLFNRELTLNFRLLEGHLNYWIMLDTIVCYLNFDNTDLYMDELYLRSLDQEGRVINTIRFDKVYFKGLSEINLAYSDNNPDFKSFSCTIGYNWMEVFIEQS
jgi:hypothetical protein